MVKPRQLGDNQRRRGQQKKTPRSDQTYFSGNVSIQFNNHLVWSCPDAVQNDQSKEQKAPDEKEKQAFELETLNLC